MVVMVNAIGSFVIILLVPVVLDDIVVVTTALALPAVRRGVVTFMVGHETCARVVVEDAVIPVVMHLQNY